MPRRTQGTSPGILLAFSTFAENVEHRWPIIISACVYWCWPGSSSSKRLVSFFFKPFRIVQKFGSEFRASSGWGRRKQTAREWKMISETEFWSCELLQENFTWLNPISRGLNITICFKLAIRAVYGNWVWGATGLFEAHLQGEKLIIRALKREPIWNLHWHRQMRLFSFRTQRCISSIHLCWFG